MLQALFDARRVFPGTRASANRVCPGRRRLRAKTAGMSSMPTHAGTPTIRSGNPTGTDQWEWRCGFYPGSNPGECTSGTAVTFDKARVFFEAAWEVFCRTARRPTSRHGATGATGPPKNIGDLIGVSGCRPVNRLKTRRCPSTFRVLETEGRQHHQAQAGFGFVAD